MKMKIDINKIKANPFRDFDLDPIDGAQVERLKNSHKQMKQMGSIPVRKAPGGYYEQMYGHHNMAAMRERGDKTVEVTVGDYSDDDMVRGLALENLTQRSNNAGAMADAVAARARVLAFEGLHTVVQTSSSGGKKAALLEHGPGAPSLYEALNGFKSTDKKAATEAGAKEVISLRDVKATVSSLKATGRMALIMSEALSRVEAIRAEERAAEEAAIAAREKAEEEARQKAEAEAKAKAEAAEKAAEEAERRAEEDAKRKAAAEKARKAAEKAKADQAKAAEKAKAERKKREEEAKKREAEAKERKAKEAAERKKIAAQKDLEAKYDIRCVSVFDLPSQEQAFREVVLSTNGLRFFPKDQQLNMAKAIREQIDKVKTKRGHDVGSATVAQYAQAELRTAMGLQRDIDEQERKRLMQESDIKRIEEHWKTVSRGVIQATSALEKIVEEEKKWSYDRSFPLDIKSLDRLNNIAARVDKLRKAVLG